MSQAGVDAAKRMTSEEPATRTFGRTVLPLVILLASPVLVVIFAYALVRLGGDLGGLPRGGMGGFVRWAAPTGTSLATVAGFATWEALLLVLLPGRIVDGPVTPAGRRLEYRDNDLLAWAVTHAAFFAAAYPLGWFSPTIIYDHFGSIITTSSLYALAGCVLLYFRGRRAPRSRDAGTSGNPIFDFFWGVELHPRIGRFDLKQFANCRLGMMSWSLIVWSCAAKQQALFGSVASSMWVVAVLQGVYVAKFFVWERGYFATLDVMHDRFGFYVCWGVLGWLPVVYPSPALYLVVHPIAITHVTATVITVVGLAALWVNHDADHQRQRVRATDAHTTIWGKPPSVIRASYQPESGGARESLLLVSGWWGIARHFHYGMEIVLALAWSLPCGFASPLPYVYVLYLAILLFHRALRDDERCRAKYGPYWDQYCERVPYRIVPGVF